MFIIYALFNRKHNKIYIGQTENIDKRIQEHNNPLNSHHSYTKRFDGEWIIIYKEEKETRVESLLREKQLKSYRGREYIKTFIPL